MEQTIHRSHGAHRAHRKRRRRIRLPWLDRFRRFDEGGFVNPEYDKTQLAIGKFVLSLLLIALLVLIVMSYQESLPVQEIY